MSQITIREIPPALENQLRILAKAEKTSLNKTIQSLLMKALGLTPDSKKKRDLSDLAGSWSVAEGEDFDHAMEEFDSIDREVWE